jgi:competence protein ComEA
VSGAVAAVLLAAGVFGLRVAWARDASTATPVTDIRATASDAAPASPGAPGAIVAASASRSAGPGTGGTAAGVASLSGAPLVVHVVGQVLHPGIVRLPPGSRVVDAVAAAGGARRGADLAGINLARLVVDGEQIRVPRPGEVVAAAPGATAAGGGAGSGAPVSLNSADVAALDSLPGIGPVLAQRIVDWRTENRRFTSVDELGEVSGIGEKLLAQLRPKVTL